MAGGGYSRDGGVMLSQGDPSMFGLVTDGQYCVRIIDESLMWDDRGADVSNVTVNASSISMALSWCTH